MSDSKFEIEEDLGVLGSKGSWNIHLARVSWFGNKASYDIRSWDEDMEKCGKGISLNEDQARELYELLKVEFEG